MTHPHQQSPQPADAGPVPRPQDVDTGFWLWVVALVLMVIGYCVDAFTTPVQGPITGYVHVLSGVFVVIVASITAAFLALLRQGYRWARTLLTGGAAATGAYAVTNLFGVERPAAAAVTFAGTAIFGVVALVGGLYLLHRKDAHAFFTR